MKKSILFLICFFMFTGCKSNQEDLLDKIDAMNEKLSNQEQIILELKSNIAEKNHIMEDIELRIDAIEKSQVQIKDVHEIISDNNTMHDDRLALYNKGITNEMINLLGNLGYSYREMLELSDETIEVIFAPGTHLDGYGFDIDLLSENDQKRLEDKGITQEEAVILNNLGYSEEEMFEISREELDFIIPNTELLENLEELGIYKEDIKYKLEKGFSYKDIIKEALYK